MRTPSDASGRASAVLSIWRWVLATPFLLRSPEHQKRWLTMALLVGAVSAVEFLMNSRSFSIDDLMRQNRYFGGVYASIAIAVVLLLLTR